MLTLTLTPGHVARVIDADTFVLYNVGVTPYERVRVLNVNGVELRDPKGPEAQAFTHEWLMRGQFNIEATGRDNFGRLLAHVFRGILNEDSLADDLIENGYATRTTIRGMKP